MMKAVALLAAAAAAAAVAGGGGGRGGVVVAVVVMNRSTRGIVGISIYYYYPSYSLPKWPHTGNPNYKWGLKPS